MLRILVIALISVLHTGCAVAPRAIEKDNLAKIRNIGVVSLVGEKFHMVHVAFMVFGNRRSEHPVGEWAIDDEAEALVKTTLERNGNYKVQPLKNLRSSLGNAQTQSIANPLDYEAVEKMLRAEAGAQGFDALIVLSKQRNEDRIAMTNQFMEGIGLYTRPLFRGTTVAAYAWYGMSVIQGSSFKPIAQTFGVVPRANPSFLEPNTAYPFKILGASHDKEEFSKLTDDDRRTIRQALSELLSRSIPTTLGELGFAIR
ncbi:MAG: hypothetical protein ACT4P9_09375 [Betaproteobacteria bacterium]